MNIITILICLSILGVSGTCITVAIILYKSFIRYYNMKQQEIDIRLKEIENKIIPIDHTKNLTYSKDILEFTRTIVGQEAVLYFKNFIDSHHIEMVTLMQVKNIVRDVATKVNNSIKRNTIDFNITLFSEMFYEHYIIECSKDYIKQLMDKHLIEIMEE